MNEILTLPDGTRVGTGLILPVSTASSFPDYATAGPMLTPAKIEEIAKSGRARGRDKFDESFIEYQRDKGSCQGFASASAVTRARIRRGLERVDLSGAYAYSLVNGGRDRGSMLEDGMVESARRGYATKATVPWDAIYPHLYDRAKADAEATRFRSFEVYAVRERESLHSALASGFDCVVAVHADTGFMRLDARGIAGGGNGPGNHAVGADGIAWDDGVGILCDGYNSWDVTYGDRGRMYLAWDRHFVSTTKHHVYYAIRSTLDDPQGENPPAVIP